MNKIGGINDRGLREDLLFIRKLEVGNKDILGRNFLSRLSAGDDEDLDEEKPVVFLSHPRRIYSGNELSVSSRSSSQKLNLCSMPTAEEPHNDFVSSTDDLLATKIAKKQLRHRLEEIYGIEHEKSERIITHYEAEPESNFKKRSKKRTVTKTNKNLTPYMKNLKNSKIKVKDYLTRLKQDQQAMKKVSVPNSQRSDLSSGTVNLKMRNTIQKCLNHISDIRSIIENGVQYQGEDDLPRRMKRMQEFSSRFSRTYLYPLTRHLEELNHLKPQSPNITQKVVESFHIIQQALQAYHNHLPSSAGNCASDKVKTLLDDALKACSLYTNLLGGINEEEQKDYLDAFKHHVALLYEDLEYNFKSKMTNIPQIEKKKQRPIEKIKKPKKVKKPKSTSWPKSRLSMYHISASFRKDVNWEKTVDLITKKKYNVKSRYKTATYKHRPPVEKVQSPAVPEKNFPLKHVGSGVRTTPLVSPVKEDEIKTMVQVQKEQEKEGGSKVNVSSEVIIEVDEEKDKEKTWNERLHNVEEQMNQECVTVRLLQLLREKYKLPAAQCGNQAAEDNAALEFLRNCLSNPTGENKEILNTLIKELDFTEDTNKNNLPVFDKANQASGKCCKKKMKEPVVTVTGAKNAKLYCIRDDSSIRIDEEEENAKDAPKTSSDYPVKNVSSTETQTDLREDRKHKSTQKSSRTSVKISRLPKTKLKKLKLLESSQAINVIQYKLDFKNFCKKNPMYDKSSAVLPWVLMGRISDRILEDALKCVSKEMEVEGLLENIYRAEFQY